MGRRGRSGMINQLRPTGRQPPVRLIVPETRNELSTGPAPPRSTGGQAVSPVALCQPNPRPD